MNNEKLVEAALEAHRDFYASLSNTTAFATIKEEFGFIVPRIIEAYVQQIRDAWEEATSAPTEVIKRLRELEGKQ